MITTFTAVADAAQETDEIVTNCKRRNEKEQIIQKNGECDNEQSNSCMKTIENCDDYNHSRNKCVFDATATEPDMSVSAATPVSACTTLCGGCGQVITDRYYLLAVDCRWHCECLRCSYCGVNLESHSTCFSRNGYIYCRQDYNKLFSRLKCCVRCHRTIKPCEYVMKVKSHLYYHVDCFTCSLCNQMFRKGDYFGLFDESIYCRIHYETIAERHRNYTIHDDENQIDCSLSKNTNTNSRKYRRTLSSNVDNPSQEVSKYEPKCENGEHDDEDENVDTEENSTRSSSCTSNVIAAQTASTPTKTSTTTFTPAIVNGGHCVDRTLHSCISSSNRGKRMRTSFKHYQLRAMKAYFGINHNPDSKDLKELSHSTGLSKRVLQVWFQNARAKWRRNILKQQSQGPQIVQECKPLAELDRDCHLITSSSTNSSESTSISPDSTSALADCEISSPLPIHSEDNHFLHQLQMQTQIERLTAVNCQ